MPFVPINEDLTTLRTPLGPELETAPRRIALPESPFAAAFRTQNVVGSVLATTSIWAKQYERAPGYTAADDPEFHGTIYEQDHSDYFVGSMSPAETKARKSIVDRELKDKRLIEDAGWAGTVANIAMGTLDPTIAIPGGQLVKGARAGYSLARSGLSVMAGVSAGVAVQEGVLYGTQATRDPEESVAAIGTATILAGLFGAGAAKWATAAERSAGISALDSIRAELKSTTGLTQSVGAAAADVRTLQPRSMVPDVVSRGYESVRSGLERLSEVPVVGRVTGPIGKIASKVLAIPEAVIKRSGPLTRMAYSTSTVGKRAAFDLVESPLEFADNEIGIPTSMRGPAVETTARIAVDGARYKLGQELDRLFSDYYFGKQVPLSKSRAALARYQGNAERLTYREFKEAVSQALMNGDIHEVPAVEAASKFVRSEIFDPWKEAAIRAKLLPPDVSTKTAESYFTRLYDKEKIIARRPEFTKVVTDWLDSDQATKGQIKGDLQRNRDLRAEKLKFVRKLDRRLATVERRQADVEARLAERGIEAGRTANRVKALEERTAALNDEIADLEEFIGDALDAIRNPELKAEIRELQTALTDLKKGDKPLTEADLARIEKEEEGGFLVGPLRKAARIALGKTKPPKVPSFGAWIAQNGGIKDTGGDVLYTLGDLKTFPGVVSTKGQSLDQWGEKLKGEFPEAFRERPGPNEVLAFINASARGRQPQWFIEAQMKPGDLVALESSVLIGRLADDAGVELKTTADVVDLFRNTEPRTLDELDAEVTAMPEGAAFNERADVEDRIRVRRETIRSLRDDVERARLLKSKAAFREGKELAREGEAKLAERANRGRSKILSDRLDRLDLQTDLLARARQNIEDELNDLRLRAEENIQRWEGKSVSEAQAALKARAEQERLRGLKQEAGIYEGKGERLTGADSAVDRAIKRIIASDRDKSRDELLDLAEQITDRILGGPDGRLPYDIASGGPSIGPPREGSPPRGPLAARQFMIPDQLIADFLVRDVEQVAHTYLGSIVPDVLLVERFGDTDMTDAFRQINEEYAARVRGAEDEAELVALRREQERVISDLAAMRDRLRGTYGYSSDTVMRNAGRIAGALGSINTLADMGGSAIAQLTDFAGPIWRYGFGSVFKGGFMPFVNGMMGAKVFKEAAEQYRAMGIGVDMHFNTRNLDEVGDQYHPRSRGERALRGAAQGFMVANLSAPMTDAAKSIAAVVSGNEILKAIKALAEGSATQKQVTSLAAGSIDQPMAERIWASFQQGGALKEGIHLPNTGDWSDLGARTAFEGAVSREANIAVITPGQEKALWLSNPVLRILGQFKAFIASSTVRLLAANLQRRDAQTLQGLLGSIAMGMLGYRAYTMVTGQDASDRWQDWVKEGVNRAGILGWLDEGNSFASKFTRGQLDAYRLVGADKPLSRYASRGVLGALLGPTAGKIENMAQAAGALASGEFTGSDTRAARRLLPLQNLWYIRRLLNEVEDGFNDAMGIPARAG